MMDFWSPAARRPCTRRDHEETDWSVHGSAHNQGWTHTLWLGLAGPRADTIISNSKCTMTVNVRFEGSRGPLGAIRMPREREADHGSMKFEAEIRFIEVPVREMAISSIPGTLRSKYRTAVL